MVRGMAHSNLTTPVAQQLSLLTPAGLPIQFLLDQRTRQRGLAHIAAIKAQLAARHTQAAEPAAAEVAGPRREAA